MFEEMASIVAQIEGSHKAAHSRVFGLKTRLSRKVALSLIGRTRRTSWAPGLTRSAEERRPRNNELEKNRLSNIDYRLFLLIHRSLLQLPRRLNSVARVAYLTGLVRVKWPATALPLHVTFVNSTITSNPRQCISNHFHLFAYIAIYSKLLSAARCRPTSLTAQRMRRSAVTASPTTQTIHKQLRSRS